MQLPVAAPRRGLLLIGLFQAASCGVGVSSHYVGGHNVDGFAREARLTAEDDDLLSLDEDVAGDVVHVVECVRRDAAG